MGAAAEPDAEPDVPAAAGVDGARPDGGAAQPVVPDLQLQRESDQLGRVRPAADARVELLPDAVDLQVQLLTAPGIGHCGESQTLGTRCGWTRPEGFDWHQPRTSTRLSRLEDTKVDVALRMLLEVERQRIETRRQTTKVAVEAGVVQQLA